MNDDDNALKQQNTIDDLKKSGVEILGEDNKNTSFPSNSADKLKREFEAEMSSQPKITTDGEDGLLLSLKHLKETKAKIELDEKTLEEEIGNKIKTLKDDKALIEEKISHLKKLEHTGAETDLKIKKIEALGEEKKQLEDEIKSFDKTVDETL